jgi:hypothetical protein
MLLRHRSPQSTSANITLTATYLRRKASGGAGEEDEEEREVWNQGEEGRVQEEEGGGGGGEGVGGCQPGQALVESSHPAVENGQLMTHL